jgi:RNA polymerase sigma factor (sigma-70 family)
MRCGRCSARFQVELPAAHIVVELALSSRRARLGLVSTSSQATSPGTTASVPPHPPAFATTHWSVVLTAARSDTTHARDALARLCQTYWHPLYGYVRRGGYSPEDAQDLTQEFFARLLEGNAVATVSPDKGRFRSFLLASMNHFLSDEWDKARAQKRGGGRVISFDTQNAEQWLGGEPSVTFTPEKAFELRWAIALLEQVYRRLEEEHRQQGKTELFDTLRTTLAGPGNSAPYAQLGIRLGMNEGAVKVAVHRLRQRYRALLRETIAETVASETEVEEELRYLLRVVAGG